MNIRKASHLNDLAIMAVAGFGPETGQWERDGKLSWLLVYGNKRNSVADPVNYLSCRYAAHALIKDARNYWKKYHVKLNDYDAVKWHLRAKKSDVEFCQAGSVVTIPTQSNSYFGSGGAWGTLDEIGDVKHVKFHNEYDNGFCRSQSRDVILNPGSIIYTAAGDSINGGRVFYRRMIIARQNG